MTGKATKLTDFARECGVSDRAIQKHLQNMREELEGHYERKGTRGGTWLDEVAVQMIRARMVTPPPPVVADNSLLMENEALKDSLLQLQGQYIELQQKMIEQSSLVAGVEAQKALLIASQERVEELREEAQQAKLEAMDAAHKVEEAERHAREAEEAVAAAQAELEAEKNRKLTLRERLTGRKE